MRSMILVALLALLGLSVANATLYAQTSVEVADVEVDECRNSNRCDMVFTAKWNWAASVNADDISSPKLQWSTKGYSVGAGRTDGWAERNADYSESIDQAAVNRFQFGYVNGVLQRQSTFTVTVHNDEFQEYTREKFEVFVYAYPTQTWNDINIHPTTVNGEATSTGIIVDKEDATLSIDDFSAVETIKRSIDRSSDNHFIFNVHLSHKMDTNIFVNYKTVVEADGPTTFYATAGPKGSAGADYEAINSSYKFSAHHDVKVPGQIAVKIWDDEIQENLETFQVELTYPGSPSAGAEPVQVDSLQYRPVSIVRNIATGTFTEEMEGSRLTMDDVTQEEGFNNGKFVFTAKLSHAVDTTVKVEIGTLDGDVSATQGTPAVSAAGVYTSKPKSTHTFNALATELLYTVQVRDDNVQSQHTQDTSDSTWGRRHFIVDYTLDNSVYWNNNGKSFWNVQANNDGSAHNVARGFIYDREGVTIAIEDAGAQQESEKFSFKVSISHDTVVGIPIKYKIASTTDLKNINAQDGTVPNSASICMKGTCGDTWDLEWQAGLPDVAADKDGQTLVLPTKKGSLSIDLAANDDDIAEPTEGFGVKIMSDDTTGTGNWEATITKAVGTGLIKDNDLLTYSFTDPAKPNTPSYKQAFRRESNGVPADADMSDFAFTVYINREVSETFSLQYYTTDITTGDFAQATADVDYVPVDDKLEYLTSKEASFTVKTIADTLVEQDEWFEVVVSHTALSTSATSFTNPDFLVQNGDLAVSVQIVDDEAPTITLVANAEFPDESSNNFIFMATLSHALDQKLTIPWYAAVGSGDICYQQNTVLPLDSCTNPTKVGSPAQDELDFDLTSNIGSLDFLATDDKLTNTQKLTLNIKNDQVQEGDTDDFEYLNIIMDKNNAFPRGLIKERNYLSKFNLDGKPLGSVADESQWLFHAFISDDEGVTLAVNNVKGSESDTNFIFSIQLSHRVEKVVNVDWESMVDDNAASPCKESDFTAKNSRVSISANALGGSVATFQVPITEDLYAEDDESFKVVLTSSDLAAVGGKFQGADGKSDQLTVLATITDDEKSTISIGDVSSQEGPGAQKFKFTVSLSHMQSKKGVSVATNFKISTKEGTAKGKDFTAVAPKPMSIGADTKSTVFEVEVLDDNLQEITETFSVMISDVDAATFHGTVAKAVGTGSILDNEGTKLTIADPVAVKEDAGQIVFVAALDHALGGTDADTPVTIQWSTTAVASQDRATPDGDFESVLSSKATFSRSEDENVLSTAEMTVQIQNDDVQEAPWAGGEKFSVVVADKPFSHGELNNAIQLVTQSATGAILDDEGAFVKVPYTRGLTSSNPAVIPFKIHLTHNVQTDLRVYYTTKSRTGDDAAVACEGAAPFTNGDVCDYVPVLNQATVIPAGTKGDVVSVDVPMAPGKDAVTLIKKVDLVITKVVALNSAGVESTNPNEIAAAWNVAVKTGVDEDGSFGGNYGTGEIFNDAGVTLSIQSVSAPEDQTPFQFTVHLSHAVADELTIGYSTADGESTAQRNNAIGSADVSNAQRDYTSQTGTVTFKSVSALEQAGESIEGLTATIDIAVYDDAINEPEQMFSVGLTTRSPAAYFTAPTNQKALITVTQESATGTILQTNENTVITIADFEQTESNKEFVFTAKISTQITDDIQFQIQLQDGSASQTDNDYAQVLVAPTDKTITFKKDVSVDGVGREAVFTVEVNDDTTQELSETFTALLQSPLNLATNGALVDIDHTDVGTATILDDDFATVSVVTEAASYAEGEEVVFEITLSTDVYTDVEVTYETGLVTDGDDIDKAIGDDVDYESATNGKVTFAKGEGTKQVRIATVDDEIQEHAETFEFKLTSVSPDVVTLSNEPAIGTITDDEGAKITIADSAAKECVKCVSDEDKDNGSVVFEVSISHEITRELELAFTIAGVTATAGKDFDEDTTLTVTLPKDQGDGEGVQKLTIALMNDAIQEFDETFTVTLEPKDQQMFDSYNLAFAKQSATGTIHEDAEGAEVTFTEDTYTVNEGETVVFTVALSHDVDTTTDSPLTLMYGTNELSAVAGGDDPDYVGVTTLASLTLVGTAGETANIEVLTQNDNIVEKNEEFTLYLSSISNDKVTANAKALGVIEDNEGATLSIADSNANEEDGSIAFVVTLSHGISDQLDVQWSTVAGTANSDDFAESTGTVSFSSTRSTESTGTIEVVLKNDDIQETREESFDVKLTSYEPVAFALSMAKESATGTITDFEKATISVSQPTGKETAGEFVFTLSLSHVFASEFSLLASTVDGTAKGADAADNSHDFINYSETVVFAADGGRDQSRTVTVALIDDLVQEQDETFTLQLNNFSAEDVLDMAGNVITQTATLTDDAEGATIEILDTNNSETGASGSDNFQFDVTLSHSVSVDVTVAFTVEEVTADAGHDFQLPTPSTSVVTFEAGAVGSTVKKIPVFIENDNVEEDSETFTVTLSDLKPTLGDLKIARATATGTIDENTSETSEGVTITCTPASAGVEGEPLEFTVTLSSGFDIDFPISYKVQVGEANQADENDVDVAEGTLKFVVGESLSQTFSVQVKADEIVEAPETFYIVLSGPDEADVPEVAGRLYTFANPGGKTMASITDTQESEVSVRDTTVAEAIDAVLSFPVELSLAVSRDVSFDYETTTTLELDFEGVRDPRPFTIPAGTTSAAIELKVYNDDVQETDESVELVIRNLGVVGNADFVNRISFGRISANGVITDEEGVTVNVEGADIAEGSGAKAALYIQLSHRTAADVTVAYNVQQTGPEKDNWATIDVDYTVQDQQAGTVTFPALDQDRRFAVDFVIQDDVIQEQAKEVVGLAISNLVVTPDAMVSKVEIGVALGFLTIVDDEGATITIGDAQGDETDGEFTFEVEASHVFEPALEINWFTEAGTATSDTDFVFAQNSISFDADNMKHTIKVPVINDDIVEGAEQFTVLLIADELSLDRYTYTGGKDSGIGLFNSDNEDGARVIVTALEGSENMGSLPVTIVLSHKVDTDVTVSWDTVAVTASPNNDFVTNSGSRVFTANEIKSQTIMIEILNDSVLECPETFDLATSVSPATRVIQAPTVPITINDDEDATLAVTTSAFEEGDSVTVNLALATGADRPYEVAWEVRDVETDKDDFTGDTSGQVTLSAAGNWKASFEISTASDDIVELDEKFNLLLSSPTDEPLCFNIANSGNVEIRIPNNDAASLSVTASGGEEGQDLIAVFTLSAATQPGFTVSAWTEDDTATAGVDYTAVAPTDLVFDGMAAESHTIAIATARDALVEVAEMVSVYGEVSESRLQVLFANGQGKGSTQLPITNTDVAEVSVDAGRGVTEGDDITFEFKLTNAVDVDVAVYFVITGEALTQGNGRATSLDYVPTRQREVVFQANSNRPVSVTVQTAADDTVELDEDIVLRSAIILASDRPVTFAADGDACPLEDNTYCAVGTIVNDDVATLTVESSDVSVREGNPALFTVRLSNPVDVNVNFNIKPVGVSATCGDDVRCEATPVTIPASTQTGSFFIITNQDDIVEGDETFNLSIEGSVAASDSFGDRGASVTSADVLGSGVIADNDSATVSIMNGSGNEADGSVDFDVIFTNQVDVDTAIAFTVTPGRDSATSADFSTSSDGSVTIPALTSTGTLSVSIANDNVAELDETFTVKMDTVEAVRATRDVSLGVSTATGTIVDDDTADFGIEITGPGIIGEKSQSALFGVQLSSSVSSPISVNVEAIDGTASSRTDFTLPADELVFNTETLLNVRVPITSDSIFDDSETFTLRASVVPKTGSALSAALSNVSASKDVVIIEGTTPTGAQGIVGGSGVEPANVLEATAWKGKRFSVARGTSQVYNLRVNSVYAQDCLSTNVDVAELVACEPVTSDVYTIELDLETAGSSDVCIGAATPRQGNTNCFTVDVFANPTTATIPDQAVLVGGSARVELTLVGGYGTSFQLSATRNDLVNISFEGATMVLTAKDRQGTSAVQVTVCDDLGCSDLSSFDVTVFEKCE